MDRTLNKKARYKIRKDIKCKEEGYEMTWSDCCQCCKFDECTEKEKYWAGIIPVFVRDIKTLMSIINKIIRGMINFCKEREWRECNNCVYYEDCENENKYYNKEFAIFMEKYKKYKSICDKYISKTKIIKSNQGIK